MPRKPGCYLFPYLSRWKPHEWDSRWPGHSVRLSLLQRCPKLGWNACEEQDRGWVEVETGTNDILTATNPRADHTPLRSICPTSLGVGRYESHFALHTPKNMVLLSFLPHDFLRRIAFSWVSLSHFFVYQQTTRKYRYHQLRKLLVAIVFQLRPD